MASPSICLLRLSAIGDVCHCVAVLRALQDTFTESRITWVIGQTEATLVSDIPGVDFIIFDKRGGFGALRQLKQNLGGRRFDALLHMQASLRGNLVSRMIRAERRIGFDRARSRDGQRFFCNEYIRPQRGQHVLDGLLGFAHHLGAKPAPPRWDIPIAPQDERFALEALGDQPTLVISPCSSQRRRNYRNWQRERYRAVARHAMEKHQLNVTICGGPSELERDYADAIQEDLPRRCIDLVGKTNLKQLLAVLARSTVLVSPDSGPAHMATTVGTPVIGLYASSNPGRTGPYLSQDWVVNRYPDAVAEEFNASVSDISWGRRVRDPNAMNLITVEDVTTKLDAVIDSMGNTAG